MALGLPAKTSTEKLLQLGVHNTWDELTEAHRASQLERLKLTKTGRATLCRLNYQGPIETENQKQRIPLDLRTHIEVASIPRNMHPVYHKKRREARAKALHRSYRNDQNSRYVDAAVYPSQINKRAHTISVVDFKGSHLSSATIKTGDTDSAEEAAVALAVTTAPETKERITVLTDSQAACRNYQKGRISKTALGILSKTFQARRNPIDIYIVWTPGHESLEGNAVADAVARDLSLREVALTGTHVLPGMPHSHPIAKRSKDILEHLRLTRRKYPPPHPKLTREESTQLRRLQTNSFPHATQLHMMYPTLYSFECQFCSGTPNTLYHMVWECKGVKELPEVLAPSPEQWEAVLTSAVLENQRGLVNRALRAAAGHGIPD